jgi:hypothetical protein
MDIQAQKQAIITRPVGHLPPTNSLLPGRGKGQGYAQGTIRSLTAIEGECIINGATAILTTHR